MYIKVLNSYIVILWLHTTCTSGVELDRKEKWEGRGEQESGEQFLELIGQFWCEG